MFKNMKFLIFPLAVFIISGCVSGLQVPERGTVTEPSVCPAPQAQKIPAGTLEDPIIDSDITLAEALKKYAPEDLKKRQRMVEVLYYSFDGKVHRGQLVIDERLVSDIREVFRVVLESKFPITSVVPISDPRFFKDGKWNEDDQSMLANNTSAFNYRKVTGGTKLSRHAYGFAIDINPVLNPYIKGKKVLPPGAVYDKNRPGTLTADCAVVRTFLRLGWTWGGNWHSLKDYQHFEKIPAGACVQGKKAKKH